MSNDIQMDKANVIYVHRVECYSVPKNNNNNNTLICDHMDEPGWHFRQWNKPYTERQIPYILIYVEPTTAKLLKVGNRMLATNGWEWGSWRAFVKDRKFIFDKRNEFQNLLLSITSITNGVVLYVWKS